MKLVCFIEDIPSFPSQGLRKLVYYSRNGSSRMEYVRSTDNKIVSADTLSDLVVEEKVAPVDPAVPLEDTKALYVDSDRDVWVADRLSPTLDTKKRKVGGYDNTVHEFFQQLDGGV